MESKSIEKDTRKKREASNIEQGELACKLPKKQENSRKYDIIEIINIDEDDCSPIAQNFPQTVMPLNADSQHTFRRRLIACVRKHRHLYDEQHPNFDSDDALAWTSIAEYLNSNPKNCRIVWANLRREYQRYVKQLQRFLNPRKKALASTRQRPCMRYEIDLMFLYRFSHSNKETRKSKEKKPAEHLSTDVSVPTRQAKHEEDVVTMNNMGPVIIDLEAEEHRVLPFKINSHLRALAECVKKYPELYDTEHHCYGNYRRRGIIWAGIAADVKEKATKLIKSWLQMLTRYEWEICIGYTPEHNEGMHLKPSPLQEMLSFIEPYIKHNTVSIFKQSRYLHIDWFETIDHFKSVANLLDALEKQPEFVQLIEDTLDQAAKPPEYDIFWRKVGEKVGCSAEQCEVTWLVLRGFFKELCELRKVGYYLQDKWYFENIIADLYKTVEKATKKPTTSSTPMQSLIPISVAKSTTQPIGITTQNLSADHSYGKPATLSKPNSLKRKKSQEPCTSKETNAAAVYSTQTSLEASQIDLATDQSKLNQKPSTTIKHLQVKAIVNAPATTTHRSSVATTSTVTSATSSLAPAKVTPNTTSSTAAASTPMTYSNEYRLPQIIGAVSLAPLSSNALSPPVLSTATSIGNLQPIPITLQALRSAAPQLLPSTLTGIPNTFPNKANVCIRRARPLVTVSVRPKQSLPNNIMNNTVARPLFGSTNITTQNVFLRPIAAANVVDNSQSAILQTTPMNFDPTRPLPPPPQIINNSAMLQTNMLRPQFIRMPTLRPHFMNNRFSNILAKVLPLTSTSLTTIATPSTTATTNPLTPSTVSSGLLLQPAAPAVLPLQSMAIVHAPNTVTVSKPETSSNPNPTISQNCATVSTTVPKMLTPTENSSTTPMRPLNSNEIMIELTSCNNIKQLVIHGPPLINKYCLSMLTTTNFIREITSIPWLYKKQPNHPAEVLERYWQYIARKFALPVHVCRACWNFLVDNISHFPEIAPLSELLKPMKNGLKIWETSHTLFQTFNASALQQGWLNCKHLPELMKLARQNTFLYIDVRQAVPNATATAADFEKAKNVWSTARFLYPSINNPAKVWFAFKKVFVSYLDDLERAIDNPWPQNWWRVLEQLKFIIDTRYNSFDPFYYTVQKKFVEEVQRCNMYEQLMNNEGVETETSPPRRRSSTVTLAGLTAPKQQQEQSAVMPEQPPVMQAQLPVMQQPPVMQAQPQVMQAQPPVVQAQPPVVQTQPAVVQAQPPVMQEHSPVMRERTNNGAINGFQFARALCGVPPIYEKNSIVEKRAAWLTLAGELQTTVANCRLTLKKTLHSYLKYRARDTGNRCYLNEKYYRHFADVYRSLQYRKAARAKKIVELKKLSDGPTEPVHPEWYVPEINMHTCSPTLVMKNWAYAASNLNQDDLYIKLRELFDKYRATDPVEVASTVGHGKYIREVY